VLACPPAVEASLYEHSLAADSNVYSVMANVTAPVAVMRAGKFWTPGEFDLTSSPTEPALAQYFPRGTDVLLAARNHYFPLQSPEIVADEIERALSTVSA